MPYAFRVRISSVVPLLHTAQEVEDQPNESGFREAVACEREQTLARACRGSRARAETGQTHVARKRRTSFPW